MRFAFIARHRNIWPVAWLCDALDVSRSGFHAWLNRSPSARSRRDEVLVTAIDRSFKSSEGLPEAIRTIAWKAQTRLCARYRRMHAAGRSTKIVTVAIARELAAFVWAIATTVPVSAKATA